MDFIEQKSQLRDFEVPSCLTSYFNVLCRVKQELTGSRFPRQLTEFPTVQRRFVNCIGYIFEG